MKFIFKCIIILSSLLGCVSLPPKPMKEYTLARTALNSAKTIDAARYAQGPFHKAVEYYRRAERMFRNKEYEKAQRYFLLAKRYAEKAENIARITMYRNGESLE